MSWLEYHKSEGYVVAIHETEPTIIPDDHGVVETEDFNPGDEFKYYITVYLDESGTPTGAFAAVQQAPPVTYLLQQLATKDKQITELQQLAADIASLLLEKGVI